MRHDTTKAVFRYFNELRAARAAPLRQEIDPAALKGVLPDLFIMEKGRDDSVRFRLAGTRVCAILGREMRDRSFTEIWEPAMRHRMRLAADTVLANRKALEIAVTASDADGHALDLEMLLLPLFSRANRCDRIFGCLVPMAPAAGLQPRLRVLAPADLEFAPVGRGEPAQVAPAAQAMPGVIGQLVGRIAHLRVFEGGRRD